MPRFVTDSRPISAQHPLTEFYREEFVKHHRCLQQQRPYYSESAITDVEAALTRIMGQLEQLCTKDNARPARQLPPQEIRRRDRAFGLVRSQTHPLTRSLARSSTRPPGHRPGRHWCGRSRPAARAGARLRAGSTARPAGASIIAAGKGRAGDGDGCRPAFRARASAAGVVVSATDAVPVPTSLTDRRRASDSHRRERTGRTPGARARASARSRRNAARAAVGRRVGADGGAGRRRDARRQAARRPSACCAPGADIHALNTVRKHLSAIKGGWLAARARRRVPHARDLRRRRRRPERHRVGPDRRRREHVCGRARRAAPLRRRSAPIRRAVVRAARSAARAAVRRRRRSPATRGCRAPTVDGRRQPPRRDARARSPRPARSAITCSASTTR